MLNVAVVHGVFSNIVVSQRSWWRLFFFLPKATTRSEDKDCPRTKVTLGRTSHFRNGPASILGQPCSSV